MWVRNLLFIAVLVAAAAGLRASLYPLNRPATPVHLDPGPMADPEFQAVVDRINESYRDDWDARGITPAPPAPDLAVARRLSLGLTGTVPSLEEIREFEAGPDGDRVDGWVNHLLRDRRFADYFADRLARVYVGTEDGLLILYRNRRFIAWISDRLHDNKPYDETVREMIAGRGLNTDNPAVNFIAAAYVDDKKGPDAEKLAIRVSRAFLGLRLDCAQCHDHFLEPSWKQSHFQGLAAFFGQTRQIVTHVSDGSGEYRYEDRITGDQVLAVPAVPFLPELMPESGTHRERLAGWVTHPENVHFARAMVNRVWALLFNKPMLGRVEVQSFSESRPPALDILAADFVDHGYDVHRLIRLIAATEVFRLDSAAPFDVTTEHELAWAVFPLTRLRPDQVIGTVIQAASVHTIDRQSHVVLRLSSYFQERDFVKRYGDPGDDEFDNSDGTVPQRLLLMNGNLVNEKTKPDMFHAAGRIANMAPDDAAAVETAYLCVLTRRPTGPERDHFIGRLAGSRGDERGRRMGDLFWALVNSSEVSWNH